MRKILPLIMVIAFWGIFYWGQSYPKVGDCITIAGLVGITVLIIISVKKIVSLLITNSK